MTASVYSRSRSRIGHETLEARPQIYKLLQHGWKCICIVSARMRSCLLIWVFFRYLHKYLIANMEDFLEIMMPLLLHSPQPGTTQKRKRPITTKGTHLQQHQQPTDSASGDKKQDEPQRPRKRRMKAARLRNACPRKIDKHSCYEQQREPTDVKVSASSLLAAQVVATVLRRAARDEESFYDCVASITNYFPV